MGCWERVKKYHPNNEEAQSAIAGLHTDKIAWLGSGKEDAKNAKKTTGGKDSTRETELRHKHEADPADVDSASDLSDLLAARSDMPRPKKCSRRRWRLAAER